MRKGNVAMDDFIKAVGIEANSQFKDIYEELYKQCFRTLMPMDIYIQNELRNDGYMSNEEFIKQRFSAQTWNRIQKAQKDGYDIYMGTLSSDDNPIESYFCTEAFVIESDNFILDATNAGW